MIRRFLANNSGVLDTARIYRLLDEVVAGAAGHGPVHLLLKKCWCHWLRLGSGTVCSG